MKCKAKPKLGTFFRGNKPALTSGHAVAPCLETSPVDPVEVTGCGRSRPHDTGVKPRPRRERTLLRQAADQQDCPLSCSRQSGSAAGAGHQQLSP